MPGHWPFLGAHSVASLDQEDRVPYSREMSATAMTAEERANAGGRDYEFWRAHDGVSLVWSNPERER